VNTFSYGAFVFPHGGLGGPPSFLACSISVVVIELWAVEAFCLTPVIACLFSVAGVLPVLLLYHASSCCYAQISTGTSPLHFTKCNANEKL
jgi:hypothetical protein